MTNDQIQRAIEYFEDAVRESDEIIEQCSAKLQAELIEQKNHFAVALAVLREKQERMNPDERQAACIVEWLNSPVDQE